MSKKDSEETGQKDLILVKWDGYAVNKDLYVLYFEGKCVILIANAGAFAGTLLQLAFELGAVDVWLRRSTSGYCVFLGDNLLTWSSKRQDTLSRSSAEAEYRGVTNAVAETSWIRNLLRELHTPLFTATCLLVIDVSANIHV
ncbi:ribonuclease H-like domain-containing protein [Tanacetum coccineum]|uniref:Ribonuclease H-like domain-containing protein n=1 Tax=Tanacetum coccineum TaxID=301880 RepID=A0ABQ4ZML3_9ASTR